MRYNNFDVVIKPRTSDGYHVEATARTDDWSRRASGVLQLDPDSADVTSAVKDLVARRTNRESMVRMGTLLHQALFSGESHRLSILFEQCMGKFQDDPNEGVCLRLIIEAPEIAVIPWELLYSPMRKTFFATSIETPLVRYFDEVGIPVRPGEIKGQIEILVVIPDAPPNAPELETAKEKQVIMRAIEDMGSSVHIQVLEGNVTPEDIHEALVRNRPHIFHFIGHGCVVDGRGYLRLPAEDLDHDRLGDLFQNCRETKLVVLNACQGAQISPNGPFTGLAPQLVKRGIPAVVAMQFAIYDDVAIQFCRSLYHSLFQGMDRGRIDMAITHARNALSVFHHEGRALCAPVLFSHSQTGVVFDVPLDKPSLRRRYSQDEVDRLEAVEKTHRRDIDRIHDTPGLNTEAMATEVAEAEGKITEIERLLKARVISFVSAVVVGFLALCLSWMGIFDLLGLDTQIASYTIALGSYFAPTSLHEDIVLVPITEETENTLESQLSSSNRADWRQHHAKLIRNLSKAGAKVIVFDMAFAEPSASADGVLSQAMSGANQTAVIIGVDEFKEGQPLVSDRIESAATAWGALLLAHKLGSMWAMPLVIEKSPDLRIPGLALQAYAASKGGDGVQICHLDIGDDDVVVHFASNAKSGHKVKFLHEQIVKNLEKDNMVGKDDTVAYLAIDKTPLSVIRDEARRWSYASILNHNEPELLTGLRGKIVIVGAAIKRLGDFYGDRWGFELHADAINTLLNGVTIRPMAASGQFSLIVIMSIAGALIGVRATTASRRMIVLLLTTVVLLYLTVTVCLYAEYRLLANTVYHLVALVSAYSITRKMARRYLKS